MKKIIIDGNQFNDLNGFYKEIKNKFTRGIDGDINLDGFNDILSGGFEIFDYGEEIIMEWKNHKKSIKDIAIYKELIDIINENSNIHLELKGK